MTPPGLLPRAPIGEPPGPGRPGRFFVGSGGPLRSPKEDLGAEHGGREGEVQGPAWDAGADSVLIDMARMTDMTGMTGQLYGLTIHRSCEFSVVVKEVREIVTSACPAAQFTRRS